ncbi:MAG: radical SAM protein [Schleiferiaceae bacterium]|nr:radical SAM protein [Schleiferiaceae bacterium]
MITKFNSQSFKAYKDVAKAAFDPSRPLLAQIVITRRCNLSCGYCYEYDKVSKPVDLKILKKRIDELKRLKVVFVTLNGGEPLLHPHAAELVKYIADKGMIPMMNSNGWLLKKDTILELNEAGLFGIQISCDGLEDNEITKKSLRRLEPKLALLKQYAKFKVRINGVLGSGNANDITEVAKTILDYGFDFQCSLIRDESGSAIVLDKDMQTAYMEIRKMKGRLPSYLHDSFQIPLIKGESVEWKCRSGARYFHLDENGLVHLCQPRAGFPAKRIKDYTRQDILDNFYLEKSCSARCPHAYAHIGSRLDQFRKQPKRMSS